MDMVAEDLLELCHKQRNGSTAVSTTYLQLLNELLEGSVGELYQARLRLFPERKPQPFSTSQLADLAELQRDLKAAHTLYAFWLKEILDSTVA